jgi:hypothetical protein
MGCIRPFVREDLPAVTALWQRAFRGSEQPPSEAVRSYFCRLFFHNPWQDENLSSLVYEAEGKGIVAFLGVVPRRMIFRGRPLRVAVATQAMADLGQRCGYASIELLRQFLLGPQDLSFTDGSNETGRRIWQGVGGEVALLYSMEWTRVLRPCQYLADLVRRRKWLGTLARVSRPACQAVDAMAARLPVNPFRPPRAAPAGEEATAETLHDCFTRLAGPQTLRPEYKKDRFAWLLAMAAEAKAYGDLRQVAVRDAHGDVLGWYVCYVKPGGIAQVLQIGGREQTIGQVLDHLFYHAWRQGALAVSGQVDPSYMHTLWDQRCSLALRDRGVLVHARNRELVDAIHRGDAYLTRLDGEWWIRLGIDRLLEW